MDPVTYESGGTDESKRRGRQAARPMPQLSCSAERPPGGAAGPLYALPGARPGMLRELRAFIDAGLRIRLHFGRRDPDTLVRAVERFDHDVVHES